MSVKKINEICTKASSNLKQKDVEGQNGEYPVYGAGGLISKVEFYHQEKEYIAIVKDGSGIGRVSFLPPKSSVIGTMQYILPVKGFDIKYVCYCLQSLDLSKYKQGAAIPHIYFKDYGERLVNVTEDETEQSRIVAQLDAAFAKIDALKENAQKGLQAVKDLWQATLKEELKPKEGWRSNPLQDVCTDFGEYGMSVPSKEFTGIRYLRITDISENGDLNNELVSADIDNVEEHYLLKDGDIVFARTGATVGKTLLYKESFGKCSFAGYLIRYRVNQKMLLPRYLFYITHSNEYYKWVQENQKASAQPNISAKLYNSYVISHPSLDDQLTIITRLDAISERYQDIMNNYNKELAEYDALKQSILRKAFSGEL